MRRALIVALFLALAAAAAAFLLLNRQRLRFTNRLVAPVTLVLGGPARTLAPRETVVLTVPRGAAPVAQWEMARPLSADGRPMGEEVRGVVVLSGARGTVADSAWMRQDGTAYFAPLISNASAELLQITVNAGLQGARDCGCAVRPGATRAFVGYYHLYENSTVRAGVAATGASATFRDLGPRVTSPDGVVGLRFEAKDLAPR